MNIYIDSEFTGLQKETTFISLALVTESNETFYAEFTDYNEDQIDTWIQQNVIEKLMFLDEKEFKIKNKNSWMIKGTTEDITVFLKSWLAQFEDIEIWSDVLAWDWVLFCSLFGTAFDLPENVYFIPFDISTIFKIKGIDPDVSREEFAEIKNTEQKHNCLQDAIVIKKCYDKLMQM